MLKGYIMISMIVRTWNKFWRGHNLSVAIAAYKRIKDPNNWTKNAFYRDENDEPTSLQNAKKFCILGSYKCSSATEEILFVLDAFERYSKKKGLKYSWLMHFNDAPETTHEDVIDFMKYAIEYCGGKVDE